MIILQNRQHGFSLLEVLIAISILSGIMMALAPAISAAAKASSRIHTNSLHHENLRTLHMFFRDTIEQNFLVSQSKEQTSLGGSATELTIPTYDPDSHRPTVLTLKIQNSSLVAEVSHQQQPGVQSIALLDDLKDAKFEYFTTENDVSKWITEWTDKIPPTLIRFSGTLNSKSIETVFSFEAAPKVTSPFDCQFDGVSRRCR